jgi:predicted enzyme related to lactoylglutathione lyase
VVLYAGDLDAMTDFYVRCVGFTLEETSDGYRGLSNDQLQLWLIQRTGATDASQHTGRAEPRSQVPIKLCCEVPNLQRAALVVASLGGSASTETWKFAGYRRCDIVDPEGNIVQLLESLD